MIAGAGDFLTKPPSVDELTSAIRRAGAKAREERSKTSQVLPSQVGAGGAAVMAASTVAFGKVITVYSPKGGTGCTTIATNLAISLHNDETQAVLVDGKLQFGDVAIFLNEQGKNSVVDLAPRADDLDPEIVDSVLVKHATTGIRILPAPHRPEDAESVSGDQLSKVLKYLCRMYSYVVVDASSTLSDLTLGIFDASDVIVLVTTQDIPSLKNCRLFLDVADALGLDRKRVLFTMNRYDKRVGILPEKISENFKQEIVAVIPLDERIVVPSVNRGVPLVISNKTQPVGRSFLSLAEVIKQRMTQYEEKEPEIQSARTGTIKK
jgi:pilus assembly protein CpaE